MPYQTILFDADGTLLDFKQTERHALNQVFFNYAIPLTEEIRLTYEQINHRLWADFEKGKIDKKTVVYTRFCELFEVFGIKVDGKRFEDDYQQLLGQGYFLIQNATEVCEALSRHFDLYIVSNGVSKTQFSRMEASGLSRFMKRIFVSEDAGYQKPMREFFDYAFERIPNFQPTSAIIVGDSLTSDIQGGVNAGIATCWFNPDRIENQTDIRPDFEIENLMQLTDIFF